MAFFFFGILLVTGCEVLVNVPIAILVIIDSENGFVGRRSKYWANIAYMGHYELAREIRIVKKQDSKRGSYLFALTVPAKESDILPKGTILRIDKIHRDADGLNYEFIDYYATIMTGRQKGNAIVINSLVRSDGNTRYLDVRYLKLIHSSSQAETDSPNKPVDATPISPVVKPKPHAPTHHI